MLENIPTQEELNELLGAKVFEVWECIVNYINETYVMETLWDIGRKAGKYEMKFRKGGKTLCTLYAREGNFGFMIIYGKSEREKFENKRSLFSEKIQAYYEDAKTYHDGKWIMIDIFDFAHVEDIKNMLEIKRKPNRK